jgi:hypothetical protein
MGHNIDHWQKPENVNKKAFEADINDYVRQHTLGEGGHGLDSPIRWIDHICDNYEDALEYIRSHDRGWYDQLAVKYYDYPKLEPTKTMITLQERLKAEREKRVSYAAAHAVSTFKAEYIGCPECGSKLKRTLLKGNSCPLCHAEMRSKTTMETLQRYDANCEELSKKIKEEERKMQEKMRKQAKVVWLIKTEYHT